MTNRRTSHSLGTLIDTLLLLACGGVLLWLLLGAAAAGGEREEVAAIAERYGLKDEVRLADSTRVDLLADLYAIEVDYSDKWAEAIGQSLHYGIMTQREPGILLIKRTEDTTLAHHRYVQRCRAVCEKYRITLWSTLEGTTDVFRVHPPADPFEKQE